MDAGFIVLLRLGAVPDLEVQMKEGVLWTRGCIPTREDDEMDSSSNLTLVESATGLGRSRMLGHDRDVGW